MLFICLHVEYRALLEYSKITSNFDNNYDLVFMTVFVVNSLKEVKGMIKIISITFVIYHGSSKIH